MTHFVQHVRAVDELCRQLVAARFGPFIGTRCEEFAALHEALAGTVGVLTVPGDDNAVAVAAGMSMAGGHPVVLLRESGPATVADAIAAVVTPHEVPMLLAVMLGGAAGPDDRATARSGRRMLDEFGIQCVPLNADLPAAGPVEQVRAIVQDRHKVAALLVPEPPRRRPE